MNVCIFCGSSPGQGQEYVEQARSVANLLADINMGLVYGGASVGVMGTLADTLLSRKGSVFGVIPQSLMEWEVGHDGLTRLEVVDNMHQRKERMYQLADLFVALPGGMGTLDELCEIITWSQLKYHQKPCFIYNPNGFFDYLLAHFRHCVSEGFLSQEHCEIARELRSFDELKNALSSFTNT